MKPMLYLITIIFILFFHCAKDECENHSDCKITEFCIEGNNDKKNYCHNFSDYMQCSTDNDCMLCSQSIYQSFACIKNRCFDRSTIIKNDIFNSNVVCCK